MTNFVDIMKSGIILSILLFFFVGLTFSQEGEAGNQVNAAGLKIGPWTGTYPSGAIRYKGSFDKGEPVGVFSYYFETGELQSTVTFITSNLNEAIHYYQTGDKMAEGQYLNKKKHGKWTTYGDKNIRVTEGFYLNGIKIDTWRTFYPNGQVAEEVNYKDGLEEGVYHAYFDNGNLKEESIYTKGYLEGPCSFYDKAGFKNIAGQYFKESRDGTWKYLNEDGSLKREIEFDKGKRLTPFTEEDYLEDMELFKDNVKDELEFEDLQGPIKYEREKK